MDVATLLLTGLVLHSATALLMFLALLNHATNAIRFTDAGSVTIRVQLEH